MSFILLSVIIPTCNRPETIIRAIDSVLIQGVKNIEIIVIDDGDNNKTKLILEEYVKKENIKNVRYIINTSEFHGAGQSRNFGVNKSIGKFITFLDDDDVYLAGRIKNLLSIMELEKYIFVSSGRFHEIDDFSVIINNQKQLKGIIKLEHVSHSNDIDIGFMMKREDFMKIGGFDTNFKNLEDWDFILRMLMCSNGYKIGRLDYAVNINNNRPRVSSKDYMGYMQIAEKHRIYFGEKWYVLMQSMAAQLNGSLSLIRAINMSLSFCTIKPLNVYIRDKLKSSIFLFRLYKLFFVDLDK